MRACVRAACVRACVFARVCVLVLVRARVCGIHAEFAIHNCRVTHELRPSKTGIFVSRVFVIFQLSSLYFILYWLSVAFLDLKFFTPYVPHHDEDGAAVVIAADSSATVAP
jgi:hypothetical protein